MASGQVFPIVTAMDAADRCLGNSEPASQFELWNAALGFQDESDLLLCQSGLPMTDATNSQMGLGVRVVICSSLESLGVLLADCASFCCTIPHVVGSGSGEEVGGIAARAIVAGMANVV